MAPALRFIPFRNRGPMNIHTRLKCWPFIVVIESPRSMPIRELLPGRYIVNLITSFTYDGSESLMRVYGFHRVIDDLLLFLSENTSLVGLPSNFMLANFFKYFSPVPGSR